MEQRITARTTILCVIGHPVGHSVSPPMHNAALQSLDLPYVYVAFDVHPDRLGNAIRGAASLGIRGMNVTIPHKSAIIPFVNRLTDRAAALGSVNTLSFINEDSIGDSTDGPGFVRSLDERGICVSGKTAVVLGSGGSARAVAYALAEQHANSLVIAGRNSDRVKALLDNMRRWHQGVAIRGSSLDPRDLEEAVSDADIVVNATPLGMSPNVEEMPPMPKEILRPGLVVCDIVFNPVQTRFLKTASSCGCITVDGRGMLLHQGALSFELWTGHPAPLDIMRKALNSSLGLR